MTLLPDLSYFLVHQYSLVKVCKDKDKAKNWSFKNKPWCDRILCQEEQLIISVFYYLKYIVLSILRKPLKRLLTGSTPSVKAF